MTPSLMFSFPYTVEARTAIDAVADHFGLKVQIMSDVLESEVARVAAAFANVTPAGLPPEPDAPVTPVNTAPPADLPPSPPAGGIDVDSTGLPWDMRIHSKPASKGDKTGIWRKKRGVTVEETKRVESELRAIGNIGAPVSHATLAASTGNVAPKGDKSNAITYAHNKAVEVCGAMPFSESTLNDLLSGKMTNLTTEQSDWYAAYFARRGVEYRNYVNNSAAVTVELDATRLPHDPSMHVSPPVKDDLGIWVQRTDVTPQAKLETMAEARTVTPGLPPAPPAPPATQPGLPPAPPQVTPAEATQSFVQFIQWIAQNKVGGRITDTMTADLMKTHGFVDTTGFGSVALVSGRADWLPFFVGEFQKMGAI